MRRLLILSVLLVAGPVATAPPASAAAPLRAGAGMTDITPPRTGYYLGGWTRADRLAEGVSSRLMASALVLQRGKRKLALVAVELFAVPAGLQEAVAARLAARGFDRTNVIMAATHTHSGPGGYANNPTYNTAAPSLETIGDPLSFYEFFDPMPADRQLYTFLVDRIANAIVRADRDRAPAVAGWGRTRLTNLTQNRSIEAHLANHGIEVPFGEGTPEMDPDGVLHTIDPGVDVLRVDKLRGGRRVPIGAWSDFANHATVVHSEFEAYSGDHHAAAWRVFAAKVRRAGRVPRRQTVVNVYPNSAEGDQTAGIANVGPAAAQRVGTVEAGAMFRAWRKAGSRLGRRPALRGRWTRACFCGRETATGPVDDEGKLGAGFLTGSEEGRGPLFDVTGVPFEGRTSPNDTPEQGNKVVIEGAGDPPPAVPLAVWRIGNRAMATIPGEGTKEFGVRVRAAVGAAMPGVRRVVLAGLGNEFVQYVTTPEEYRQQSYEGASSLFGPNEGTFIAERLAELGTALASRSPAPEPFALDPFYGVQPDGEPYPPGAEAGTLTAQPGDVARLERAVVEWTGGPTGSDLPNGRAFVTAQRRVGGRWKRYADDLGLQFLWRVDGSDYTGQWEVPLSAPVGRYRLVVSASRYRLASSPFRVKPTAALKVERVAGGVRLRYPDAIVNVDLTSRPVAASGGVVRSSAGVVRRRRGSVFKVPAGASISAARDRFGNRVGA
ncbi:MAG: neutral/alkaline non-lysosomal ceramidase N-terminal domain-containing protein [Solirubrobacteraceae bacterium]